MDVRALSIFYTYYFKYLNELLCLRTLIKSVNFALKSQSQLQVKELYLNCKIRPYFLIIIKFTDYFRVMKNELSGYNARATI